MSQLEIRKLSPTVGAQVTGFDPLAPVGADDWGLLCRAFDACGVLVFRDIDLDLATQHKVIEVLHAGDSAAMEDAETEGCSYISNKEANGGAPYGRLLYHVDMMWSEIPFQTPSLYAVDVEQPSVPTTFTNTVHSWKTLPAELKERVKGLSARHESGQQGRGDTQYEDELIMPHWGRPHDTVTPIAMPHPRTGEIMLYVCEQQTREIVGLPKAESDRLLDALFAHLYRPEGIIEHHWRTRDFVAWDNQSIQHSRPYVKGGGPARTLRKVHAPYKALRSYLREIADIPTYAEAD